MAVLVLGGEEINIPVLNFRQIKKAWPHMMKASQVDDVDPMATFNEAIEAIRVGLEVKNSDGEWECPIPFVEFEERLQGPEVVKMQSTLSQMMREAGLIKTVGGAIVGNEGVLEAPENSSTET